MTKADQQIEAGLAKVVGPDGPTAKNVADVEGELAAVNAALAALSATDRAAPACYAVRNPAGPGRFSRDPASACQPVVRPNWTLFNPALLRSAPQLLVIGHFERCLGDQPPAASPGGCAANRQLLQGLDQQALQGWLQ